MSLHPRSLRRRVACAAILLSICFEPSLANASCDQGDLEGRWRIYANVSAQDAPSWMNCALVIAANGGISDARCDGPSDRNLQVSAGAIKVADTTNCAFAGFFELDGAPG